MTRKKRLFFAGILVCLAAAAWGYYLYHKPRTTASDVATDASITAVKLYEAFAKDEQAAGKLYTNKVLEITGTIQEAKISDTNASLLLSAGDGQMGGVNCSLAPGQTAGKLTTGQTVHIKGRCTGFLMDVNLVDVVIK